MDKIEFPVGLSEEVRLQVCKLLVEKDEQIQKLEDKVFDLDAKLSDFAGSLNWRDAENLKQQMNIIQYENDASVRELKKFNLRVVRYLVDDAHPSQDGTIRPFDIKIEKISILERLSIWIKSLIKFQIVRKT